MTGIQFFRERLCTGKDETERFNDFVSYVSEYGLEYEVFDMCMERIKDAVDDMSREDIECELSIQGLSWDI